MRPAAAGRYYSSLLEGPYNSDRYYRKIGPMFMLKTQECWLSDNHFWSPSQLGAKTRTTRALDDGTIRRLRRIDDDNIESFVFQAHSDPQNLCFASDGI
jgi:hypothetical protein